MLPDLWKYVDIITSKPQPVHAFMAEVAEVFVHDPEGVQLIREAYPASSKGHHNEFRDSGERYFLHVLSVACILLWLMKKGRLAPDAELIVAALLHDLVENKPKQWSRVRIEKQFTSRVSRLVEGVTKPHKHRFIGNRRARNLAAYRKLRRHGWGAIILRIADRLHNIKTPWGKREKIFQYLKETEEFVWPLSVELEILVEELRLAMEELRIALDTDSDFITHRGAVPLKK